MNDYKQRIVRVLKAIKMTPGTDHYLGYSDKLGWGIHGAQEGPIYLQLPISEFDNEEKALAQFEIFFKYRIKDLELTELALARQEEVARLGYNPKYKYLLDLIEDYVVDCRGFHISDCTLSVPEKENRKVWRDKILKEINRLTSKRNPVG